MDVLHLAFILDQRQKFPGESNVVVKGPTESGFILYYSCMTLNFCTAQFPHL